MPEVVYGLFCEDIRAEEGGKCSLMGTLGETVESIGPPPLRMRLAFHALVRNHERRPVPFELVLQLPGEDPVTLRDVLTVANQSTVNQLNWIFDTVTVHEAGAVTVQLSLMTEPTPSVRTFALAVEFPRDPR